MKPSNQIKIWGFIDPTPPVDGTYRAEIFRAVEQAEGTPLERVVVERFAQAIKRMNNAAIENVARILGREQK